MTLTRTSFSLVLPDAFRRILGGFAVLMFLGAPVMAQGLPGAVPPSAAELALPSSVVPAPTVAVTTTTTTPAAASNPSGAPRTVDPCPLPKSAIENDPDDLAKVQEDIDRFTLCVQRAQLLERLNESAQKSVASTDAALGYGNMMGMGGTLPTGMPAGMAPLPAGALGGIDVTPAPAAPAVAPAATTDETSAAETTATEVAAAPEVQWTIREIFGSAVDMQARLLSPQGDEVKVKKGSRLPDGGSVTSVTPSGVSIRNAKGVQSLAWSAGS